MVDIGDEQKDPPTSGPLMRNLMELVGVEHKYADRVVQQFSSKEKIVLEIIKDLRLFVGGSLREFSNHNSRLPNKLVFSRTGVDDGSFQKELNKE
ncbi:unnamed protein product [Rotaria sp. Silwood1]|nr:unnamed protein product [Rotaria sp. Silwood1]CAF3863303.1 unnamed protein product [Rotaria sp. Silwood1]CAF4915292.1 unnamed protein product [Rotaria sp. Silwood1]CAF5009101.1 unnamed protein product [Rotaria sp. Silwood1]